MARKGSEPVYPASALRGDGVVETLEGILRLTWRNLNKRYRLEEKLQVEEEEFISHILGRKNVDAVHAPGQPGQSGGAP